MKNKQFLETSQALFKNCINTLIVKMLEYSKSSQDVLMAEESLSILKEDIKNMDFEQCLEYIDNEGDPFHNFEVASKLQHSTVKQAVLGMMDKHVVSIHDMVVNEKEGHQYSLKQWTEKIIDNINYLVILYCITDEQWDEKLLDKSITISISE